MSPTDRPDVVLYDTTLRDGAQQQGVSLTVTDKLTIITLLDTLGVAYIEAGWPGAIPKDTELFERARDLTLTTARLTAFGATCRPGTSAATDPQVQALLASGAPAVTVVAKSDPLHVAKALRTTPSENLRMVTDTVQVLRAAGREAMVDLEHYFDGLTHDDGTTTPYPLQVALAAADAGATTVIACDTNGGTLPTHVAQHIHTLRTTLDRAGHTAVAVGVHTHDDAGCAVASSLAAVEAGATHVQGCVNGLGERTGNANLLTLAADLELKTTHTCLPGDATERARRLTDLSHVARRVSEVTNRPVPTRAPYVGTKAFAHKAGLHASAIRVDPSLYQHTDPAAVGNTMTMLVSEMAGRASIELKARELGIDDADDALLTRVTTLVKEREAAGYSYDAADGSFELLLRSVRGDLPEYFRVESWRASVSAQPSAGERFLPADGSTRTQSEAVVRMWIGGRRHAVLGEGNGPVNALDQALCDALAEEYPVTAGFELVDYKVRILDAERGTRAIIRVLIDFTDGEREWSTVGVGTDIIEASWEALTDGHVVGMLRAGTTPR